MTRLFTREQARAFLKENKLTDGDSIQKALVKEFGELLQEALETELDHELGYSKYDWKNKETDNSRNGHTKKTVSSKFGKMDISIPRDTKGEFNPAIVKKHERRLNNSVEDMIISMYAKGMSTRDIDKHVGEIYGLDISAELVTRITDKVIPIAKEWQNRPLEEFYPILYLDGMVFNVKQDGQITKKTVYLITAINICGEKDVLGIWIGETESAKFWMSVLTDISNNWKDRKQFCSDMREIYTAPNEEAGSNALDRFDDKWGNKYPYAIKSWRNNWSSLSTLFKYPEEIRKIIYTTNPIESLNRTIRKVTKTKSSFPTNESLFKLLYMVIMDTQDSTSKARRDWSQIMNQLVVHYGERVSKYL